MKKIYNLILLAAIPASLNAQIQLTQSDMPSIGTTDIKGIDTTTTVSPGPAGTNQTWNFSSLLNQRQDTTGTYIDPLTNPYIGAFPTANVVGHQTGQDGVTIHFMMESSPTEFKILGIGIFGSPLIFAPARTLMNLPANYSDAFSGTSVSDAIFPTGQPAPDSVRKKITTDYSSEFDAWGSVTTPAGTYNSLRQVYITKETDSTWAHIPGPGWIFASVTIKNDTAYQWWTNGEGSHVLEIKISAKGSAKDTVSSYEVNPLTTGITIENASNQNATAYPNPAANYITIKIGSENTTSILIFDINGRLVINQPFTGKTVSVNTDNLNSGNYLFKILNADATVAGSGKFSVAR